MVALPDGRGGRDRSDDTGRSDTPGAADAAETDLVACYRTDRNGLIEYVGCGWDEFADDADSPEARADHVTGRPLEAFIADPTTRMIYRAVGDRVRATARPARFPFRCDAPDRRRFMLMEVTPRQDGGLEYRTYLRASEPRPPVPVTGGPEHGRPMLMCGWCKRVEHEGAWIEVEDALTRMRTAEMDAPPLVSHGMCPPCLADMEASIEAMVG